MVSPLGNRRVLSLNNWIVTFCGRSAMASAISVCKPLANDSYDSLAITVSRLTRCTSLPKTLASMRSPCPFTQRRSPRPTSWRLRTSAELCFRVQIWKTFGLSHPSRRAECEKIKRIGSFRSSRRSLFFIIKSYASSSVYSLVPRSVLLSISFPFLSLEKYPSWAFDATVDFR